jgi:hypothetical protein
LNLLLPALGAPRPTVNVYRQHLADLLPAAVLLRERGPAVRQPPTCCRARSPSSVDTCRCHCTSPPPVRAGGTPGRATA